MSWFKWLLARDARLQRTLNKRRHKHGPVIQRRLCCVEPLESRVLLAHDVYLTGAPGQNPRGPLDANVDHYVTPLDALIIINAIHHPEESHSTRVHRHLFPDADGDGFVSAKDALRVINDLNSGTKTDWFSVILDSQGSSVPDGAMGEGPIGGGGGSGGGGSSGGGSGGCTAPTITGPTDVNEYEIFTVSGVAFGATSVSVTASGAVWAYVDIVGIDNPVYGWQYDSETGAYSRMIIFKDDSPPNTSQDPATVTINVQGDCPGTATHSLTIHNVDVTVGTSWATINWKFTLISNGTTIQTWTKSATLDPAGTGGTLAIP